MLVGSCIWGTICKYENGMPKMARNAFNIGEFWNQHVAMATKMLNLHCGAYLVESNCKESNIWHKLAETSFFIIFDQNLVTWQGFKK